LRKAFAIALLAAAAAAPASAATMPYDEAADAKADIRAALAEAKRAKVPVLVVFGANWCGDCRALDLSFKSGASAALVAGSFRVVKVNVGRFDRNVDIAESYGVPLKKGIPAVAVLSQDGQLLEATRAGELADARSMGDSGIHEFFSRIARKAGALP